MIIPIVLIAVALGMVGTRLFLRSPAGVRLVANVEKARRDRVRQGGKRGSNKRPEPPKPTSAPLEREIEPPDGYDKVLD